MAEKDLATKYLEDYNDVFADIVNVLLYQGKQIVLAEQLTEAGTESQYKSDGQVHQQTRDIAKYWGNHTRIALLGIENQTTIDKDMVLRIIGYDGAAYRKQISTNTKKEPYPVITIILYFGTKYWDAPTSLYERLNIPDIVKPYVNDYQIHIFEIAYLTDSQLNLFTSDFKIVADYFVQKRKNKEYVPSTEVIQHVDAVLQMLHALTGDNRFENTYTSRKGAQTNMSEILLDKIENRGIEKGLKIVAGRLLTDGTLAIDKIAEYCQLSIEEVKELAEKGV